MLLWTRTVRCSGTSLLVGVQDAREREREQTVPKMSVFAEHMSAGSGRRCSRPSRLRTKDTRERKRERETLSRERERERERERLSLSRERERERRLRARSAGHIRASLCGIFRRAGCVRLAPDFVPFLPKGSLRPTFPCVSCVCLPLPCKTLGGIGRFPQVKGYYRLATALVAADKFDHAMACAAARASSLSLSLGFPPRTRAH